eukprot:3534227-Amphidinium_carterae.1
MFHKPSKSWTERISASVRTSVGCKGATLAPFTSTTKEPSATALQAMAICSATPSSPVTLSLRLWVCNSDAHIAGEPCWILLIPQRHYASWLYLRDFHQSLLALDVARQPAGERPEAWHGKTSSSSGKTSACRAQTVQ